MKISFFTLLPLDLFFVPFILRFFFTVVAFQWNGFLWLLCFLLFFHHSSELFPVSILNVHLNKKYLKFVCSSVCLLRLKTDYHATAHVDYVHQNTFDQPKTLSKSCSLPLVTASVYLRTPSVSSGSATVTAPDLPRIRRKPEGFRHLGGKASLSLSPRGASSRPGPGVRDITRGPGSGHRLRITL